MSTDRSEKSSGVAEQTRRSEGLAGFRDAVPLMIPVVTFAMIFGAAAAAAGHSIGIALWASASMFAGASQFVFLDVYRLGVPAWSVALAVFAVNFRHLLYSASVSNKIDHFPPIRRVAAFFLLTDLQFAQVEKRFENHGGRLPVTLSYYFSFGIPLYFIWLAGTLIGAVFGSLIEDPAMIGLDFILPIYFVTILMGFRSRSHFVPVVLTSALVAIGVEQTVGAPWHISIGAVAGVIAAMVLSVFRAPERAGSIDSGPIGNAPIEDREGGDDAGKGRDE